MKSKEEIQQQKDETELDHIFSRMIHLRREIKKSFNENERKFLNEEYSNLMDFLDGISDYSKLSGENVEIISDEYGNVITKF
jgi:hypothetical protein